MAVKIPTSWHSRICMLTKDFHQHTSVSPTYIFTNSRFDSKLLNIMVYHLSPNLSQFSKTFMDITPPHVYKNKPHLLVI